jgi:hypothetical protein
MLRHWLGVLQHFQEMQCLHLQRLRGPRRMDLYLFPFLYPSAVIGEGTTFLWIVSTHERSVISQSTWILNNTAVETAKCVWLVHRITSLVLSSVTQYSLWIGSELLTFQWYWGVNSKYCCGLRGVNCVVPLNALVTVLYAEACIEGFVECHWITDVSGRV